jgi:probable phosphomutase (TIGR03848 family)
MTTFYLIRHATNDFVGKAIAGWSAGVRLNAAGREQAERLGAKMAGRGIAALYSSPLERALETAEPIARTLQLNVEVREALGEVRFGDWTGKRMDELARDPHWEMFNRYRSGTRAPGGELAVESQARMVVELETLRERHPDQTIAVVSHADIIRAALVYYLGVPIDLYQRIECRPASFSTLTLSDWGPQVLGLNDTAE